MHVGLNRLAPILLFSGEVSRLAFKISLVRFNAGVESSFEFKNWCALISYVLEHSSPIYIYYIYFFILSKFNLVSFDLKLKCSEWSIEAKIKE